MYIWSLIFLSLAITVRTIRFNIQEFYMVVTLRLCVGVRILQQTETFALHSISRLVWCNRDGECLQRGTH